jgi:hypothetical protein
VRSGGWRVVGVAVIAAVLVEVSSLCTTGLRPVLAAADEDDGALVLVAACPCGCHRAAPASPVGLKQPALLRAALELWMEIGRSLLAPSRDFRACSGFASREEPPPRPVA